MKIEFLYFDGCPSYVKSLAILQDFLSEKMESSEIRLVNVETQSEAEAHQFVGSPSIRFDGLDLVPPPPDQAFALGCRIYQTPDGPKGIPPLELLHTAYAQAISKSAHKGHN